MSQWSCCNCDPDENGCVYGWRVPQTDEESLCFHTTTQELYLNIPRPAYSFAWDWVQLLDGQFSCACTGIDFGQGLQAGAESDIEGKYAHFDGASTGSVQADNDFPWFYDHGGLPGTSNWNAGALWPNAQHPRNCCGYDEGSSGYDDALCASGAYTSTTNCSSYRWTRGPSGARFCTRHQQEIIDEGESPKLDPLNTNERKCDTYGYAYRWLKEISNNDDSEQFPHWVYDVNTSSIQPVGTEFSPQRELAETLVAVFHQEIWWENYYNSLYEEEGNNAATCRMMEYASFACGGIPIYSWELLDLHKTDLENEMSTYTAEDILEHIYLGKPLATEMKDAMVTVGLLVLGDWDQDDGEPIKKVIKYHDGRGWITDTRYYFARPGGWSLICPGASQNMELWPQIPRNNSSWTPNCCGGAPPCQAGTSIMGWFETYACMSAAPFPNSSESCHAVNGCGIWNACSTGALPRNCQYGQLLQNRFNIDQWASDCQGIAFRYQVYCNQGVNIGSDPYTCCLTNDAHLCVVAPGSTQCKMDLDSLYEQFWHWIPERVSDSYRNNEGTALSDLCCGGKGVFGSSAECPAPTPQAADCQYP